MKLYRHMIAICVLMMLTSCSAVKNFNEDSQQKKNATDTEQVAQLEENPLPKDTNYNDQEKATQYHLQGVTYLEKEDYENALEWFEKSFVEDPEYLLAHFHFAKTLGILMEEDYPTWFDRKQDIIEHLKKVVELNPDYVKHIEEDAHFDVIRKEYAYQLLTGLSINNSEDVNKILQRLDWYILGEGIVPVIGGITFHEDQTFTLWYYPTEFWKAYDDTLEKLQYHGHYEVNINNITLQLDEKMLKRSNREDIYNNDTLYEEGMILKGVLDQQGSLMFDILDYPFDSSYPEFSA
ncbi:hypothetical protein HZI73_03300 [Vallitalea pronyensis]|uniref:Tetratricopeptide repeat protein n=1 Tax=Vallitalea pronyensis TaxID=1348613 RepID=A0A8J8MGX0_9FIRM|nr:hypothetical protein [Vallitalea pronyensis]QUI21369.1 hypothetical protein HZI73_03300 [Vallitalea pronyensis]